MGLLMKNFVNIRGNIKMNDVFHKIGGRFNEEFKISI